MPKYIKNHRHNLELYWQQFYPNWKIPLGYHVHHIKPKCTFTDTTDPRINHPRNLIALHPDDHQSIHRLRGDKIAVTGMIIVACRKMSQKTKDKISKSNKGKVRTDAQRAVTSQARKGIKRPPELIAATAEKNRGKKRTPETCQRISESKLGKNNPNFGKKLSNETRQKMSDSAKGKQKSAEARANMSKAKLGKKRGPYKTGQTLKKRIT